jgi:hypothetical protein
MHPVALRPSLNIRAAAPAWGLAGAEHEKRARFLRAPWRFRTRARLRNCGTEERRRLNRRTALASCRSGLAVAVFLDAGGAADLLANVVELRAADQPVAEHLDPVDARGVKHEASFDAD